MRERDREGERRVGYVNMYMLYVNPFSELNFFAFWKKTQ